MSIQHFHQPGHPHAWGSDPHRGQPCYYCAEVLVDPFILWMGIGEPIALHPACTVELSIRLLRDVHAIECSSGTNITRRDAHTELRATMRPVQR